MKQHIENRASILTKATVVRALLLISLLAPSLLRAQGQTIDWFNFDLKSGTTPPYLGTLLVTKITDPAGHSCCVTPPPGEIEVYLSDGRLEVRVIGNGSFYPWLDFNPIPVDSNLAFLAQSRATVAGFNNIQTVLSGNVTPEGIVGSFNIGADGGLPSGQPIIYEFLISAVGGLRLLHPPSSYFALHLEAGVGISLDNVQADEEKPEDFFLVLRDDLKAPEADWWLVTLSGGELRSFDLDTLTFQPGLRPIYQGPTIDALDPVRFWSFPEGQTEEITVFFGIDTKQNGVLDEAELFGVGHTFYFN